ncbi:MAG TPA: ATP-grasp domain-containing protein [Acidimicrobiia bacterium]|nr:ATP-grasp domain-containing protein [Acidimicrobiia bacterium]
MPRVILLLPTATYRAPDFVRAANALGVEVVVASEEAQVLADQMGDRALVVPFDDPERAAEAIVEVATRIPVDAVIAVDEAGVLPEALAATRLGLSHNPPDAVAATRNKILLRERLAAAGVPQPRFAVVNPGDDVAAVAASVGFPCVVKPVSLSASRGVIRADTPEAVRAAADRVREILARADVGAEARPDPDGPLLVEQYVPGMEVAVEGLVTDGHLDVLAVFDKPEPMEGPYFAETILVTPSRLTPDALESLRRITADAVAAVGLVEGPVHAEARVDGEAVWFLELAARSIGGLCSRVLRFGTGATLEEVILRQALRLPVSDLRLSEGSAGVAMLSPPAAGVLKAVRGTDDALGVPEVEEIDVLARPGTEVAPLPESARYLGFVFARGDDPGAVEAALKDAVDRIDIVVSTP